MVEYIIEALSWLVDNIQDAILQASPFTELEWLRVFDRPTPVQ